MSVLTKGLAMDFQRQGLTGMAITSIWPAVVCILYRLLIKHLIYHALTIRRLLNQELREK